MCYADGSVKTHFKAGSNVYKTYEDFFKKHRLHDISDVEFVALHANFEKRLQSWHGKLLWTTVINEKNDFGRNAFSSIKFRIPPKGRTRKIDKFSRRKQRCEIEVCWWSKETISVGFTWQFASPKYVGKCLCWHACSRV